MVAQMASMGLSLAVSLPGIVLAVLAIALSNAVLGWVALIVAPAIGCAVLVIGVRWGARRFDRHAPELLQKMLSFA
jgi:ABC-2 type transport system permease protein